MRQGIADLMMAGAVALMLVAMWHLLRAMVDASIKAGVFGAPSYVIAGEIFWGQDRLDFVQRRLARG